jgi:hypothetical protein
MTDIVPAKTLWPRRMRRADAVRYLREVCGIPFEEKTLANRNAAGLAPRPEYLGTIPFYRPEVLDAFAATVFTSESPVAVTRRRHAEVERAGREHEQVEQPCAQRRRRHLTNPTSAA